MQYEKFKVYFKSDILMRKTKNNKFFMKKNIALLLICSSIIAYSQDTPGEYTIDNAKINTKYSDFGTSFFGENKVIFASPKDDIMLTRKTWSGNDQPFLDLFIGIIDKDGRIINKKKITGDVNNKYHEGVVAFTKDLKTVYFSANNYTEKHKAKKDSTGMVNIQLYKATLSGEGEWHSVTKLPFNNDAFSTGHPTLNVDDTKLYFVSDRPESIGKTDIFVVDIHEDGTYGEPKNLGNKINTVEREMFPFISGDDILYFSSNGHAGHGDLDVFASKLFDSTISDPINLEDPVNSEKDDFAFIIKDSIHKGYFSSNRANGKGDDDIYSFISFPPIKIEGKQVVTGEVIDKETLELIPQAVVILEDENGLELQRKTINTVGNSDVELSTIDLHKNNRDLITAISGDAKDIQIKRSVDDLFPSANQEVEFAIEVTNRGTADVTGINIQDVLPEGYVYVSDDGDGEYRSAADLLALTTLAPGETRTIKIKAIAPSTTNVNREAVTALTGNIKDVEIKRSVDNLFPSKDQEVEFAIEVSNKGTADITGINIQDILPEGYVYVSDDGNGEYRSAADLLALTTLAPGETRTFKIKAIAPETENSNREAVTAITGDIKDVQIKRSVDNLFPSANQEVEFAIEVTNRGMADVSGINIQDILPEGYVYVSDDGDGEYRSATDMLALTTLGPGETRMIKIKAVAPNTDNLNREAVSAIAGDIKNIQIKRSVDDLFPSANQEVEFAIEVTNRGTADITGVNIQDILPEGYVYVSDDGDGEYRSATDLLALNTLAPGETRIFRIKAIAPEAINSNREAATAITGDIKDVQIKRSVDNLFPSKNQEVEFAIEVTNRGTADVSGINIQDILPEGYVYVSDDGSGEYRSLADMLALTTLGPGETKTFKIKAKALKDFNKLPPVDNIFTFNVKSNTNYKIIVEAPGFLREERDFTTTNETGIAPINMALKLDPELRVINDKLMVNINTIYFDYGKSNIRPDAAKELNKVIGVMKEHPSLKIEAGSHTDSRSREAFNQRLSERRAKSTVSYIVASGIDRSRITAKGYGEMQLTNDCSSFVKCSEAEHQLNRRTEFVIVNDNDRISSASKSNQDIDTSASENTEVQSDVVQNEVGVSTDSLAVAHNFIKFKPMYYKFDNWSLSNEELQQTDKVIQVMKENPNLVVEVNVHTDAKNIESYNQKFSDKRAGTIVDYIQSKGIDAKRVSGKGFGETRLTNHCSSFVKCSEAEQQANRRVEFMVVEGNAYPASETVERYGSENYINHNPIYFDFDKSIIRKDAAYEMDRVVRMMKDNPNLKIIAESHTDSQNIETYNQLLSQKRANSTKKYLVSKGINSDRIAVKGYGEKRLTNRCSSFVKCSPEEHQANRRTEFKIVSGE